MLRYFSFALIVTLWCGCSSSPTISVTTHASEESSGTKTKIVEQFYQAFNAHDWPKMAGYYADSVDMLDPSYGIQVQKMSRKEIQAKYEELHKGIPTIHDSIVNMIEKGNQVLVEFISSGNTADGQSFQLPIATVLQFEGERIISDHTYYNNQ
jgi:ketosteroid isomerase-like protein